MIITLISRVPMYIWSKFMQIKLTHKHFILVLFVKISDIIKVKTKFFSNLRNINIVSFFLHNIKGSQSCYLTKKRVFIDTRHSSETFRILNYTEPLY